MFEKIKQLFSTAHLESKATKKSNNTIALEVLMGKWGAGKTRKKKLTQAGYDYNAIQKIVNDRMTKKSVDTVAHEVIDAKWGAGEMRKKCLTIAGYNYNTVQNRVNEILNPKKDTLQKWYDAMQTQFNWSKNQKYEFVKPTVDSSKTKGTCITFVAVSLQRLGLLPSGGYFYFYPTTQKIFVKPKSWFTDHKDWFELSYPNKTIKELGNNIKKGDIVAYDNPAYHIMVYMGKNSKGEPIFNTMGHTKGLSITYPYYANRKVAMIVRLKKINTTK